MHKNEQIRFLESELEKSIQGYLVALAHYKTMTSLFMSRPKDDKLNAEQASAKMRVDAMDTQIRSLKGVIEEVKNGTITI